MEESEGCENGMIMIDKENKGNSNKQETGTENDTKDCISDPNNQKHFIVIQENMKLSENITEDGKLLDTVKNHDEEGLCEAVTEEDSGSFCNSPDKEYAVGRQGAIVYNAECTSPVSDRDNVMDLSISECVKDRNKPGFDDAKATDGISSGKQPEKHEISAMRNSNQTIKTTQGCCLLPSGKLPNFNLEYETEQTLDKESEKLLESEQKAKAISQVATHSEQEVVPNRAIFEVNDNYENKKSSTEVLNVTEMTMDAKLSVKQENNAEVLPRKFRPRRKSSTHINYDENKLWDSETFFQNTKGDITNDCHSRQTRKLPNSKKTNEKPRIIHCNSHFAEIFKNLHKLQKGGKYCDVKMCSMDGDVLAHSVVLIAASSLLHKRLKQKLNSVESLNYSHITDLDFKEVPFWALEKIVTFLYTGFLEVLGKDTKPLSKHCKNLGLNELHAMLNSKSPVNLDAAVEALHEEGDKSRTEKSLKSGKEDRELGSANDSVNKKSSKRKLKGEKSSGLKAKVSKQSLNLKKVKTEEENSVIVKVETSENAFEEFDKDIMSTEKELLDKSDSENEVNEDMNGDNDEWKANSCDSGNDTDTYILNEKIKERGKVRKKSTKAKRLQTKDKQRKVNKAKGKGKEKVTKTKGKVFAETYSKTEENHSKLVENIINESKNKTNDDFMNLEKIEEKMSLDFGTGTGNGGECDKCGKSFYFQYELTGHRNKCTGKNNRQRRKCVTCHMNFETTDEYMDHRNNDERCIALRQEKLIIRKQKRFEMRRKYCCCACSRKFRRLADQIEHEFLAHEIQYDKEKWPDLYCEHCKYWSMNPWKLHHHKLVSCNKGQEPICDMCGNSYKNEKTLKKHKELMHLEVQPMLTCEECGKTLKGQKGLKHHIRLRHRGENLHNLMMCHICSQTYRTSSDLTFHLYKVHEQPLPEGFTVYRCPRCDYCHNNKRFFDKHMFLHEDKREWHCEICSKAFKTKNSLTTHMIVHTSSRIPCPFDDCTYKALKNCHLKNHIENQHTQKGEKHEKCHLCDYSTFFRGNLIKHQRSVHKLEVVTRHSVEMKAKYKNMKSGQIVGAEMNNSSEKKNNRGRSGNSVYQASNLEVRPGQEASYPVSSSSDNSLGENQRHFQEKSVPVPPSQNVADSFIYTIGNAARMPHHSNYTNMNMYCIPPIDFSLYNQTSSTDQM